MKWTESLLFSPLLTISPLILQYITQQTHTCSQSAGPSSVVLQHGRVGNSPVVDPVATARFLGWGYFLAGNASCSLRVPGAGWCPLVAPLSTCKSMYKDTITTAIHYNTRLHVQVTNNQPVQYSPYSSHTISLDNNALFVKK